MLDLEFVLNSENVEPEEIKYYLTLQSWTENGMEIQVNFTNPLIISKGAKPDKLIFKVINKKLFRSKLSDEVLKSTRVYI